MTIFGFNTDVKHRGHRYHVQSEARKSDLLIQTLVFVKGHASERGRFLRAAGPIPDFSDQASTNCSIQHKTVIDAISERNINSILGSGRESKM